MSSPTTFRIGDGAAVAPDTARSLWSHSARQELVQVAKAYHSVITYEDLAARIVSDTGVKTNTILPNWIGAVLVDVARDCRERGEPLLSSLCVRQDGTVGEGYAAAAGIDLIGAALEAHAATERFECNKAFGAAMPADGGKPALARQPRAAVPARVSRAKPEPRTGNLCPTCFTQMSLTGACDNCD